MFSKLHKWYQIAQSITYFKTSYDSHLCHYAYVMSFFSFQYYFRIYAILSTNFPNENLSLHKRDHESSCFSSDHNDFLSIIWYPSISMYVYSCRFSVFNTPTGIYLLKVNNRNTTAMCEICRKVTLKTPERRQ